MYRPILLSILFVSTAFAQSGTSLLQGDFFSCFNGLDGAPRVSWQAVDASGPGFSRAIRITTTQTSTNDWDLRLRCFQTRTAKRADAVVATFWIRSTRSTPANTTFVVEKGASPWTKSAQSTVRATSEWSRVDVPFNMIEDYDNTVAANTYNLSFWVNFPNQEIEIGGFSILNYGQNFDFSTLNLPNWPYSGVAADAPWRAAAASRIEQFRKATLAVFATDAQGRPVANAPVRIRMKRHAFGFGTAVAGQRMREESADNTRYRQFLKDNFNKVVTENDLKWPFWETWARPYADAVLPWFQQNGFNMVRGHVVIWPGNENLPADVVAMLRANPVDKDALRRRISTHIADVMAYTRGRVSEWDVLNEPVNNRDVMNALGDDEMIEWFRLARVADPSVKLYVNDFSNVENPESSHMQSFLQICRTLVDKNAPFDGIGLQAHFGSSFTGIPRVIEVLDQFAAFGKELQITEFDINITDNRLQAQYTRDFLTASFSHPAMAGFMLWGFYEGSHWLPNGAMVRRDWSTKPNYDVWRDLIHNQWWTNVDAVTGPDGAFRTRAFLGDYDIEVQVNGEWKRSSVTLQKNQENRVSPGRLPGATSAAGVVNAASFTSGAIAPGQIITLFGSNFGAPQLTLASYVNGRLPTSAGETRVLFNGQPAPMIYSAPGQVSAIVPYAASGSTTIEVEHQGVKTNAVPVQVAPAAPGIFACGNNANLPVLVNNSENGAISCNPNFRIRPGAILTLFLTGEGLLDRPIPDGQLPTAPFPAPAGTLAVRLNDTALPSCPASFAGLV
jgi:uncharacterized protein (TIGR03437 family)